MTTTTSFFDKRRFCGLYQSTFRRNIGYFGLICVLFVIFYPLQYAMEAFQQVHVADLSYPLSNDPLYLYDFYGLGQNFTSISAIFFTAIVLVTPIVLSLLLNSYMQSKKAADVYHALPIRRELLLSVNLAVAMSFIAIPAVVSTLAIALMQIIRFGFLPALLGLMFLDLFGWLVAALCIYAVTTFVSVLVGTLFDAFVLSAALLVSLPAVFGLFLLLASQWLHGFAISDGMTTLLSNLSPALMMPMRFAFEALSNGTILSGFGADNAFAMSNLAIAVWFVVGVLLLCLTARLYRTRNSEMAETTTSKGLLQVMIKLIGVILASVCTGLLFQVFRGRYGLSIFYLWAAIGGVLGYVIIEVILNRGFKTLGRSLPLGAAMLAVTLGGCGLISAGGLGYENRVPDAARIISAEISDMGRYDSNIQWLGEPVAPPDDETQRGIYRDSKSVGTVTLREEASIAAVLAFHQAAASEKYSENESALLDAGKRGAYPNITITYRLNGGGSLTRYYRTTTTETLELLAPLEANSEFVQQTHPAFFTAPQNVIEWTFANPFGVHNITENFRTEDSAALLEAIRTDLLAITLDDLLHPVAPPYALISYRASYPPEGNQFAATYGYFYVTSPSQQTYRFLEQKGLLDRLLLNESDCIAVTTDSATRSYNNNSAINQLPPDSDRYSAETLDDIRRSIAAKNQYLAEHPEDITLSGFESGERYVGKYGDIPELFESQADIAAFFQAIVPCAGVNTQIISANFYFKNAQSSTSVHVALDRLPPALQKKVSAAAEFYQ